MTNYYVTDSRNLETAGPMSYDDAVKWLGDACERNEMDRNDWQHPEYWTGSEAPPSLYTEEEWQAMQE